MTHDSDLPKKRYRYFLVLCPLLTSRILSLAITSELAYTQARYEISRGKMQDLYKARLGLPPYTSTTTKFLFVPALLCLQLPSANTSRC